MSYVMQGAQRMSHAVAFGATDPTDGWFVHDSFYYLFGGEMYPGEIASPEPSLPSDPTVAQWVAEKCAAGQHVYKSAVYESTLTPVGRKQLDLLAVADALPSSQGSRFAPVACPGQKPPPQAESNKALIFGAMALVAAAGGFYLYKRR